MNTQQITVQVIEVESMSDRVTAGLLQVQQRMGMLRDDISQETLETFLKLAADMIAASRLRMFPQDFDVEAAVNRYRQKRECQCQKSAIEVPLAAEA